MIIPDGEDSWWRAHRQSQACWAAPGSLEGTGRGQGARGLSEQGTVPLWAIALASGRKLTRSDFCFVEIATWVMWQDIGGRKGASGL